MLNLMLVEEADCFLLQSRRGIVVSVTLITHSRQVRKRVYQSAMEEVAVTPFFFPFWLTWYVCYGVLLFLFCVPFRFCRHVYARGLVQ